MVFCLAVSVLPYRLAVFSDSAPHTVTFDGTDEWSRFQYTKSWSTLAAGDYRFQMDCKILSGEPIIRVGKDVTGERLPEQSNYSAVYDRTKYKYTITFTFAADWTGNLGVTVGNYGDFSSFLCANPKLYLLDAAGVPGGDNLINTFAGDYYSDTRQGDKWARRGSGYSCKGYSEKNFSDTEGVYLTYTQRINRLLEGLLGRKARTYHTYEDVNRDGAFDVSDIIHTKKLQNAAAESGATQSPEDYMINTVNGSTYDGSPNYDAARVFTGGINAIAKRKREEILSTGNTEEVYNITGNKYYIQKGAALSTIPQTLNAGDAVLFERGGVWRIGDSSLTVPEGVIFGAYGKGDKPRILGSAKNYVTADWTKVSGNIWKVSFSGGNAGIIVFDEIYALGVKKSSKSELTADYDFYSADTEGKIYLYYSGNPRTDFSSIEIGRRVNIIDMRSFAAVDNLCVRYTGAHGITMSSGTHDSVITNCEVGFIGGSNQSSTVRFGNGIEMQLGEKNVKVNHNYVYQCYDAGITFQSWASANMETYYDGIEIRDNLVEFCYYGLEFFTTQPDRGESYSEIHNVNVKNNIFRFSGYGWSYEQRPDHWMCAHIRSSQRGWYPEMENFNIEDNTFDCSRASMIFWWWNSNDGTYSHPVPHPGVTVGNNSFYQALTPDKRCLTYRNQDTVYVKNSTEFRLATVKFDPSPKVIKWVSKL